MVSIQRRNEVGTPLRHPERHLPASQPPSQSPEQATRFIYPCHSPWSAPALRVVTGRRKSTSPVRVAAESGPEQHGILGRDRIDDRSGEARCGGTSEVNLQVDARLFRNRRLTFQDCASVRALALSDVDRHRRCWPARSISATPCRFPSRRSENVSGPALLHQSVLG